MERPVMNPMFVGDVGEGPVRPRSRLKRLLRLLGRVLLADVLFWRPRRAKLREGHPLLRAVRAVLYRLAFVPIFVAILACILVFVGTHPPRAADAADPVTEGIYYDPVTFLSSDGVRLEGWLVPLLDARRILSDKEDALRRKAPGVVLVHDFGQSRGQMMPLIRPLHEAGYVVVAFSLRGSGQSGWRGCTFGINESRDVLAAADMLRRRQYIDPQRIAILGVGTGANAALLAAARDPSLTRLVLDHPVADPSAAVAAYIGPSQRWLGWMQPLCKWTFQLGYRVDAEELSIARHAAAKSPGVLLLDDPAGPASFSRKGMAKVTAFLNAHLANQEPALSGSD